MTTEKQALTSEWQPEDGGLRAWIVLVSALFSNGLVIGLVLAYGFIYAELLVYNETLGTPILAAEASLVMSLRTGVLYVVKPFGGILVGAVGYRAIGFLGASFFAVAFLTSSWFLQSTSILYFTFAILSGIGSGLVELTSVAVLGFYFQRRLGLVNGVVTSACTIFASIFPLLMKILVQNLGLPAMFRVLAGIMFATSLFAFLYKIPADAPELDRTKRCNLINYNVLTNKKLLAWCFSLMFANFGIFPPLVHIVKYANVYFPTQDGNVMLICINLSSLPFRILFGILSDRQVLDTIKLHQIAVLLAGLATILVPMSTSWPLLIIVVIMIGVFNGVFFCLIGPIAAQLCGPTGAAQAIGLMSGISALPAMAGPVVAGYLFDLTASYEIPFYISGGSLVLSSVLLTAAHYLPSNNLKSEDKLFS